MKIEKGLQNTLLAPHEGKKVSITYVAKVSELHPMHGKEQNAIGFVTRSRQGRLFVGSDDGLINTLLAFADEITDLKAL